MRVRDGAEDSKRTQGRRAKEIAVRREINGSNS
jgi:hypothetical protein